MKTTPILLNCHTVGSDDRLLWKLETTEGVLFVYDNLFRQALRTANLELPDTNMGKTLRGLALKNKLYRHHAGDLIPESKTERFKDDGFHAEIPLGFDKDSNPMGESFDYKLYTETNPSQNLARIELMYKRNDNDNYYWISTNKGNFSVPDGWVLNFLKSFGIDTLMWYVPHLFKYLLVVNEIEEHKPGDLVPGSNNIRFSKPGKHVRGILQLVGDPNWEAFNKYREME